MWKPIRTSNSRRTNFEDLGSCNTARLAEYPFKNDRISDSHPIRVAATKTTLYDLDTGEIIAWVAPGFTFYWAHWHPHVCPDGWQGETPA